MHGAVSLLLAGAMCLLPFLIPYHQPPPRSFYPEWLAAALGLIAFVAVLAGPGFPSIALPVPARWLIGFAAFVLVCAIGAVGTMLVLTGVGVWCWQAWRRHCIALQPATWWVVAAVVVELIHSLLEFPMWSAHFLGVAALLMGTPTGAPVPIHP